MTPSLTRRPDGNVGALVTRPGAYEIPSVHIALLFARKKVAKC